MFNISTDISFRFQKGNSDIDNYLRTRYNTALQNGDKDPTQSQYLKWCELMQHWWVPMKRLDNIHISSHPIEMIIETKTLQIYDVLYTYKTCPIQTPTNFRMSGQLQPCYVKSNENKVSYQCRWRRECRPSLSVISAAFIALGRSCLFANTSSTASRSSSYNIERYLNH